ncbi:MAG: aminotransferase class III-fold pyridoxal phosphate-dependent enzyme [Butyricimonas faecihominis]
MGNPLACAAANASLDLIRVTIWTNMIGHIQDQLERELAPAREFPNVADRRGVGRYRRGGDEGTREHGADSSRCERGRVVRPFGKLVYVMPPFIIRDWELQRLTSALLHVISYLK